MICPNCKEPVAEGAKFCGKCGTPLQQAEKPADSFASQMPNGQMGYQQMQSNPVPPQMSNMQNGSAQMQQMPVAAKKPMSKLTIALIVELIALLLFGYGVKQVAETRFSPEYVAEQYFVHKANGDFDEAYEALEIEQSEFLSEDSFQKIFASRGMVVDNYHVDSEYESGIGKDGMEQRQMTISYQGENESDTYTYYIELEKQKNKKLFLFDDWKVVSDDMICEDFQLAVLPGAAVSVDGIKLGKEYLDSENDTESYGKPMDIYVIPKIFWGMHDVEVALDGRVSQKDCFSLMKDSPIYALEEMEPTEEVKQELCKKAGENMWKIYNAALQGKSFSSVQKLFSSSSYTRGDVKEQYESLCDSFADVKRLKCTEITAESGEDMSVSVQFKYEIDYESFWWGEDTYKGTEESSVTFTEEDGNWVQTSLGASYLYY